MKILMRSTILQHETIVNHIPNNPSIFRKKIMIGLMIRKETDSRRITEAPLKGVPIIKGITRFEGLRGRIELISNGKCARDIH